MTVRKLKVLADADLILEFFFNRSGYVEAAEELLELAQSQEIQLYVTDQCLSKICFYLSKPEPRLGEEAANFIEAMLDECVIDVEYNHVQQARTIAIKDLESAIEIACAISTNIDVIITCNPTNFAGSKFPIISVDGLTKYRFLEALYRVLESPSSIVKDNFVKYKHLEEIQYREKVELLENLLDKTNEIDFSNFSGHGYLLEKSPYTDYYGTTVLVKKQIEDLDFLLALPYTD